MRQASCRFDGGSGSVIHKMQQKPPRLGMVRDGEQRVRKRVHTVTSGCLKVAMNQRSFLGQVDSSFSPGHCPGFMMGVLFGVLSC